MQDKEEGAGCGSPVETSAKQRRPKEVPLGYTDRRGSGDPRGQPSGCKQIPPYFIEKITPAPRLKQSRHSGSADPRGDEVSPCST